MVESLAAGNTTVLVTGANRGVGRGLVEHYLQRPNHTVVAAVRDPECETAKSIADLKKGDCSSVIIVKIDSTSETDAADAIQYLQSDHGITELNVVIANAAISKVLPPVSQVKSSDMLEHFQTNVLGVIQLFQATLPLLNNAKSPKFVTVSTTQGSTQSIHTLPYPNAAYGTSKAAVNHLTRRIHFEHQNIIAFALSPGWTQTDMGRHGADLLGIPDKIDLYGHSVDRSVEGMTKVIDVANRPRISGQFLSFDGGLLTW